MISKEGNYLNAVPLAIIIGLVLNLFLGKYVKSDKGIAFVEKKVLNLSIMLLGANLIIEHNYISFDIILFLVLIIIFSILVCYVLGRAVGLSKKLSLLLGVGNGICGSSAIAATSSIIKPEKYDIGISIAIINVLSIISMFVLPEILVNSNEQTSGLVIGSTIQAVGQVRGAGLAISNNVEYYAVFYKMIRILLLGPTIIILSYYYSNRNNDGIDKNSKLIPNFILGFIILFLVSNFYQIPENILDWNGKLSKFLLVMSMAAIGLKISLIDVIKRGLKPLFIGSISSILQILFVLLLVRYVV